MKLRIYYPVVFSIAIANAAMAASPDYMLEDCKNNSQVFFQDFDARSEVKYEGQRVDGTHAVNGTIYLKGRSETFQCSYNAAGNTLVDFYAEGKSQPTFVKGGGSPHATGSGGSGGSSAPAASTSAGSDSKYTYRCKLEVKNEGTPRIMGCDFSQRQGFVRIYLEDGAEYALEPVGDRPGNFRDTVRNVPVYRKSGLGDKGLVFDSPTETISVYW